MTGETVGATTTEALQDAARRASGLLRSVQHPDAPVPGMNWTVSETAAHMVGELTDYAAFARGEPKPGAPAGPAGPADGRGMTPVDGLDYGGKDQ